MEFSHKLHKLVHFLEKSCCSLIILRNRASDIKSFEDLLKCVNLSSATILAYSWSTFEFVKEKMILRFFKSLVDYASDYVFHVKVSVYVS